MCKRFSFHCVFNNFKTKQINLFILYFFAQGGWTALMWAAYKNRTDVVQLLLEKGANPNITGQVLSLT